MEEIAESIEDVRGGPLAISARWGAADAICDREVVEEPAEDLDFRRGSEALRVVPFVSLDRRLGLMLLK